MITQKINIKALSVNKARQGRRFKSNEYKAYEQACLCMLKSAKLDKDCKMSVYISFGFSNTMSDIDNGIKPLLDILQKKYDINDRNIYQLTICKDIVKKGEEYIEFSIDKMDI